MTMDVGSNTMTMDDELKRIKERKAEELKRLSQLRHERMENLKKAEEAPKSVTEEDKINVMNYFLTAEAYEYWKFLYNSENLDDFFFFGTRKGLLRLLTFNICLFCRCLQNLKFISFEFF